jgi:hypothetical protein
VMRIDLGGLKPRFSPKTATHSHAQHTTETSIAS